MGYFQVFKKQHIRYRIKMYMNQSIFTQMLFFRVESLQKVSEKNVSIFYCIRELTIKLAKFGHLNLVHQCVLRFCVYFNHYTPTEVFGIIKNVFADGTLVQELFF